MLDIVLLSVVFLALCVASYTDSKTREVPDWVSFALIGSVLGVRFIWAVLHSNWMVAGSGLIGLAVGAGIGLLLFYTGQWGGGDTKLLMGVGAAFGVSWALTDQFLGFMVNLVVVGSLYGILASCVMAAQHWRMFVKSFQLQYAGWRKYRWGAHGIALLIVVMIIANPDLILKVLLASLLGLFYLTLLLLLFSKAVEQSSMLRWVSPDKVTEGEWIAKDIMVGKKKISGPQDLGITRSQIRELMKAYHAGKIKKVFIKVGIPFVPSFLIAFACTVLWGNILLLLL